MQTKILGEICRPKQWKTVATSQLSEEGYPVYGANGIIGKYKEYNHENETILVTCRGATCGALNICEPFSYVNGNAMALDNLDQSIDLKYLYYFLKGRGFHDVISGSAQPQIIRSAIERIEVPICDIETQKEITKSFVKIEELIESKKKILANLDNLVKARFVEMFGKIKNRVTIEESNVFISDGNYSAKYPRSSDFVEAGVPFIRANNIKDGTVIDDDLYYISAEKHSELKKGHVKPGDLLITTRGNIGQLGIVPPRHDDSNINAQIVLIRANQNNYRPEYLLYALQTNEVEDQFRKQQTGTALKQLPVGNLRKVSFIDAPLSLQNQFASFVAQVDKSKFALSNELAMGDFYVRLIHDCIMHGRIDL